MTRHARESVRVPGTKKPDIAEEGLSDGMEANHLATSMSTGCGKKREKLRCAMFVLLLLVGTGVICSAIFL